MANWISRYFLFSSMDKNITYVLYLYKGSTFTKNLQSLQTKKYNRGKNFISLIPELIHDNLCKFGNVGK